MSNNDSVRNLQGFLRNISQHNSGVTTVIPDGKFGPRTENSLKNFQREYGLPVTGEADYETWIKVTGVNDMYTASELPPYCISPLPDYVLPLKEGSNEAFVYLLQAILKVISDNGGDFAVEINGVYDDNTTEAVKYIQRISGISESGITDIKTWNSLAGIYSEAVKK